MRVLGAFVAAVVVLAGSSSAQLTTITRNTTTNASAPTSTPAAANACAVVSSLVSSLAAASPTATTYLIPPSQALACLQSVPLDVDRSSSFIDYLVPFLQFQSTLAYLKDPPTGYLLPGVDIIGGLGLMKQNIQNGMYTSQWAFEIDLHSLVNIMPHDFHLTLPLGLLQKGPFAFRTGNIVVSISKDGLSIPEIFFFSDLQQQGLAENSPLSWIPSPVVSINGQPVSDYLQKISLTSNYQDPDALYNQVFHSIPMAFQLAGDWFDIGGYPFGFPGDYSSYTFANGSSATIPNYAEVVNFNGIDTGEALFTSFEIPPTTTTTQASTAAPTAPPSITTDMVTSTTSLSIVPGYPSPVVIHSEGYTSGYFLDSETAVLSISAFAGKLSGADQEMQAVIQDFLANCTGTGKTKLIVDLSANGGGHIFSGYDAFKQLFPSTQPFGGSRWRATPLAHYFTEVFNLEDFSGTFNTGYQIQSELDVNLQPFSNPEVLFGPYKFHGDDFGAEMRYNLSDATLTTAGGQGIVVSGYGSRSNLAPQPFASENIVMLMDGSCGSTCYLFAEMMKSQGNVRTVAVGGRPQLGPMQGVGGSKGSQDLSFTNILSYLAEVVELAQDFPSFTLPSLPSPTDVWLPSQFQPPLGPNLGKEQPNFNFRNSYKQGDVSQTPTQFIYEAANCRLFYTINDLEGMTSLWSRVANVVWGNGTCVPGSTVNPDNTISSAANETVQFSPDFATKFDFFTGPGSLNSTGFGNSTGNGNSTRFGNSTVNPIMQSNFTGSVTQSPTPSTVLTSDAEALMSNGVIFVGAIAVLVACL